MSRRIYIGNLPYSTTDSALSELFSEHGTVTGIQLITDRDTGRSKGYGFVEMATAEMADKAIKALNGTLLGGRTLNVSEAHPKPNNGTSGNYGADKRKGGSDREHSDRKRDGRGRGRDRDDRDYRGY